MDREEVSTEFTPAATELLRGSWTALRLTPLRWPSAFGLPVLGALLFAVMVGSGLPQPWFYYVFAALLVAVVPVMFLVNLGRVLRQREDLCPLRYRFDAHGMLMGNRSGEALLPWHVIRRVRLAGGFLLLHVSGNKTYCVPLRALEPGEAEAVMSIARAAAVRARAAA